MASSSCLPLPRACSLRIPSCILHAHSAFSQRARHSSTSLAPPPFDAAAFRKMGHRMVDDLAEQLAGLPQGRVWTPMPAEVRCALRAPASSVCAATPLPEVYADYLRLVAPYHSGNRHPGFMGWAQGGASPVGALAELLSGGLNMNCGGPQPLLPPPLSLALPGLARGGRCHTGFAAPAASAVESFLMSFVMMGVVMQW